LDEKNSSVDQLIYREYNKEVDQLSKQALQLDDDGIYYAMGTRIQTKRFEILPIS
jgi:hypothetical protein